MEQPSWIFRLGLVRCSGEAGNLSSAGVPVEVGNWEHGISPVKMERTISYH